MRTSWLPIILIAIMCTCKSEEDPGPDLSGSISFKLDGIRPEQSFYIVISDTTGNILGWKKLVDGEATPMPYPSDPKLANVTLVQTRILSGGDLITTLETYAEIAGDDYFLDLSSTAVPEIITNGEIKITVPNLADYYLYTTYISGATILTGYDNSGETLAASYALGSGEHNLYIELARSAPSPGSPDYRYLYTPNVKESEITITPEDFEALTPVDAHVLNYPDNDKMDLTFAVITGTIPNGGYSLDVTQWERNQPPIVRYPNIPNLFPEYTTSIASFGIDGKLYITYITAPNVVTDITTLQADIVHHESFTTKHISADLSGDGDVITVSDAFGPAENSVQWNIYAPVTSKLRINPPQFSDELLKELPALEAVKEQSVGDLTVYDYNMSYDEWYKTRLKDNFSFRPKETRATDFNLDDLYGGRKSADDHERMARVREFFKRHGIKMPGS